MKWADLLKKLGVSLEDDVPTVDGDDKGDKDNNKADKDKGGASEKDNNKEGETGDTGGTGDNGPAVEAGWFNLETLEIDETKIHNDEVLKAVKLLKEQLEEKKLQADIDAKITEHLKGRKLNVKIETIKKNLDYSKIKRGEDGNIEGVLEAIKELEKDEPGFFNINGGQDNEEDEDEYNPLFEAFNPTEETDGNGEITLDEAWADLRLK
jgi:hypothetical protein